MPDATVRPTKKQREILSYIQQFIAEHGYSPSYREIMNGLNYTSVATVSLHVNSLIRRGHLAKRDHSARSLEVLSPEVEPQIVVPKQITSAPTDNVAEGDTDPVYDQHCSWLRQQIEARQAEYRVEASQTSNDVDRADQLRKLQILIEAAEITGYPSLAAEFRNKDV